MNMRNQRHMSIASPRRCSMARSSSATSDRMTDSISSSTDGAKQWRTRFSNARCTASSRTEIRLNGNVSYKGALAKVFVIMVVVIVDVVVAVVVVGLGAVALRLSAGPCSGDG